MNWKEIKLPKLWRTKGAQYALCAAVMAALALLCWPQIFAGESKAEQKNGTAGAAFDPNEEKQRLSDILSSIKNAGKVEVMITYEGEAEKVPAYDDNRTHLFHGGYAKQKHDKPIHLSKADFRHGGFGGDYGKAAECAGRCDRWPRARTDLSVQLALSRAAQTALGVEASKVEVFEMKP